MKRKKNLMMKKRKTHHITHITHASLCCKRSSTWGLKRLSPHKKRKTLRITHASLCHKRSSAGGIKRLSPQEKRKTLRITHITRANLARSSTLRIWASLLFTCSSPAIDDELKDALDADVLKDVLNADELKDALNGAEMKVLPWTT